MSAPHCLAQPLEIAFAQRDRPAPRHAAGRVRETDEHLALSALEQLNDRSKVLAARPL